MNKDTVWSAYYDDAERFADVINGLIVSGQLLVDARDLKERDRVCLPPKLKATWDEKEQVIWKRKMYRDAFWEVSTGVNYFLVGLESQEHIDYELPFRMMKYDVAEYEKQYQKIKKLVKAEGNQNCSGEYLYGFRKTDKLLPIVTLVLYGGAESWDGPRRLADMFDLEKVPEPFRTLVSDYKINIIELREIEDTSVFKTDFRYVVDVIKVSRDKERLQELLRDNPVYQKLEPETYDVIAAYVNSKKLAQKKETCMIGGKVNMCKALQDWLAEEKEEGILIGVIRTARKYGATSDEIMIELMSDYELEEVKARQLCVEY